MPKKKMPNGFNQLVIVSDWGYSMSLAGETLTNGERIEISMPDGTIVSGVIEDTEVDISDQRDTVIEHVYHLVVELFGDKLPIRLRADMAARRVDQSPTQEK